jgi:hypothetical protein
MDTKPTPKKLQRLAAKGMKAARGRAIIAGLEPKPAWQQAIPPIKIRRCHQFLIMINAKQST